MTSTATNCFSPNILNKDFILADDVRKKSGISFDATGKGKYFDVYELFIDSIKD